jgi:hypothetical protein
MRTAHAIAPLVTACLLAAGAPPVVASAASAAAAAQAEPTCTARVLTTRAVNLQHDGKGADVVRARLGNTITRERSYALGQTRNTNVDGEEVFSGPVRVSLEVEVRNVAWLPIDYRNVSCEDATHTFTLRNGDAAYKARIVVRLR